MEDDPQTLPTIPPMQSGNDEPQAVPSSMPTRTGMIKQSSSGIYSYNVGGGSPGCLPER